MTDLVHIPLTHFYTILLITNHETLYSTLCVCVCVSHTHTVYNNICTGRVAVMVNSVI